MGLVFCLTFETAHIAVCVGGCSLGKTTACDSMLNRARPDQIAHARQNDSAAVKAKQQEIEEHAAQIATKSKEKDALHKKLVIAQGYNESNKHEFEMLKMLKENIDVLLTEQKSLETNLDALKQEHTEKLDQLEQLKQRIDELSRSARAAEPDTLIGASPGPHLTLRYSLGRSLGP